MKKVTQTSLKMYISSVNTVKTIRTSKKKKQLFLNLSAQPEVT